VGTGLLALFLCLGSGELLAALYDREEPMIGTWVRLRLSKSHTVRIWCRGIHPAWNIASLYGLALGVTWHIAGSGYSLREETR